MSRLLIAYDGSTPREDAEEAAAIAAEGRVLAADAGLAAAPRERPPREPQTRDATSRGHDAKSS